MHQWGRHELDKQVRGLVDRRLERLERRHGRKEEGRKTAKGRRAFEMCCLRNHKRYRFARAIQKGWHCGGDKGRGMNVTRTARKRGWHLPGVNGRRRGRNSEKRRDVGGGNTAVTRVIRHRHVTSNYRIPCRDHGRNAVKVDATCKKKSAQTAENTTRSLRSDTEFTTYTSAQRASSGGIGCSSSDGGREE